MTSKAEILSDTEKNATVYSYNALNQLKTSKTTDVVNNEVTSDKVYTYDQNGNNTKEVDSTKNITKEMTYDVDNRLDIYTQTEGTKVTTQSNLYNGNGQRVQKQEGDNTINYFYQDGNVVYTTNGDGDKTSHNFIGVEGNIISTIRYNLSGLEYYVYNKDIKGSTSNIVDNNNNAKISYIYSDFGETEEVGDKTFYNEIAYIGGIYDETISLYYLNARYYNPEDARFITQDTYRGEKDKPETAHLYVYCANNPINYVDPSGHVACEILVGRAIYLATIALLAGLAAYTTTENFKSSWRSFCAKVGNGLSNIANIIVKKGKGITSWSKDKILKVMTNLERFTVIAKADANITKKMKEKRGKYFCAYRRTFRCGGKAISYVEITNAIEFNTAKNRLKNGKNVFASSKTKAKTLVKKFRNVRAPENHSYSKKQEPGYYSHYNVTYRGKKSHVWFYEIK